MRVNNTIPQKGLSAQSQFPEELPAKVGSTLVLPHQKVFLRDQFPEALPPAVGSTRILLGRSFSEIYTATVSPRVLRKSQYPDPPPIKIGEEDLPGGFKLSNRMNGKSSPMYDLSRGIVQIDDIAVFFDAKA